MFTEQLLLAQHDIRTVRRSVSTGSGLCMESGIVETVPMKTFALRQKNYFDEVGLLENIQELNLSPTTSTIDENEKLSDEDMFVNSSESLEECTASVGETDFVEFPFKLTNNIEFSPEGHCINYESRSYENVFSTQNLNISMLVGYLCLTLASTFFIFSIFSLFIAPFLEPTTHRILEFLRTDSLYCYLVPLSVPTASFFIYANWLSMKYFKHS